MRSPRTLKATRLCIESLEPREVPASLAGRVFLDFDNSGTFDGPDSGIQGVTLSLSGGGLTTPVTVQSDTQGNFTFTSLVAGTYTLTETQPTTPANQSGKDHAGSANGNTAVANVISAIKLSANASATGYTFAEVPLISTGGTVFEDTNGNGKFDSGEPGIPNASVTLTGISVVTHQQITPITVTTNALGAYSFPNLAPGRYTITETQPAGFSDGKEQNGTPAAASVSNDRFAGIDLTQSATESGGFNFGEVRGGTISGVVFNDVNNDGAQAATGEPGIPGVKVHLTGRTSSGQAVTMTATTGADGSYNFGNLQPGIYTVRETQPSTFADGKDAVGSSGGNATAVNDQISGIVLASHGTATGYTFGEIADSDLRLAQSPSVTLVNPGGSVTITYTLRNRGSAPATASTATLNFGGLSFVSASVPAQFNSTTKVWTVGTLAAGASATIKITYRTMGAGTFTPSAHAATTATELSTKYNGSSSVVLAGVPTSAPASLAFPDLGSGMGLLGAAIMMQAMSGDISWLASPAARPFVQQFLANAYQSSMSFLAGSGGGPMAGIAQMTANISSMVGNMLGVPVSPPPVVPPIRIGSASPAKSTIAVSKESFSVAGTTTVTLTARDQNGRRLTTGGATVTFSLGTDAGHGTFGTVTDKHNGTYTAILTGTTAGANTVTATLNGQTVTTTSPTITVIDDSGMTSTMPAVSDSHWVAGANGLKTWDVVTGSGTPVAAANKISVFYTGWLAANGTKFDSRRSPSASADFTLTSLIQGWQKGLIGMKPGGIRRLLIPSALGYGAAGSPPNVPANADLVFEIKLVSTSA
jgi:hypothetical protein